MTPALRTILLQGTAYTVARRKSFQAVQRAILAGNPTRLYFGGMPSELTGFAFTTSTGVAPASGTDNVGLFLDRSYGSANVGSDLSDTMNTAAARTVGGTNLVEQDGDAVKVTFVDNSAGASINFSAVGGLTANLTVGAWYRVTGEAKVNTGSVDLSFLAAVTTNIPVTSTTYVPFEVYILASNATACLTRFANMGAGEIVWTRDIKVCQISGIPATQATAGSRPTLLLNAAGRYDLNFDASDDAITAALASGGTPAVVTFADTGEITGYDSATTTAFTLGQTTMAGKKVSLIVASATALPADDLAWIRRFAGLLRGSVY